MATIYPDTDPEVRRVRYEVHNFKTHVITYLAVLLVLSFLGMLGGGWWGWGWGFHGLFSLIMLVWGIVLAFQGARLFGGHVGQEWEDRMVDQIMARRRGGYAYPAPGPIVAPPPGPGAAPPQTPPAPTR